MDLRKELQVISRTGKYIMGFRQSKLAVLNKKAKLLILARNCPDEIKIEAEIISKTTGIPVLKTDVSAEDMGLALRKPFGAACIAVLDPGSSSILEAVGEKEGE
ncbi:MAG TPA: 50S ribosomal protein L30e [Candidatus Caldiarchaeum subterraneum]|uniref:50S ribosomal protein L30e n=1 Tax=Caldiarchaeum subterraneum TaxID=311458 RepID=A0A833EC79_CALS0|nr:50S ribosomal protein L30e [Candidatus Caldarchaeum subterraneum]